MTDLVERLREVAGRINSGTGLIADCWSAMLDAADEIERLREVAGHYQCEYNLAAKRLAEAEQERDRMRHGWQRECTDTDLLLQSLGLCPSEYRSEGGSLLLGRIRHKLRPDSTAVADQPSADPEATIHKEVGISRAGKSCKTADKGTAT